MTDKKVVIITGGAGGIGSAVCKKFSNEGYIVVLVDTDAAGMAREAEYRNKGCEVIFRRVDITDDAAVETLVQETIAQYGRIDVMHNNAGVLGKTHDFLEMDPDEFRTVLNVNLVSAMQFTRLCAKQMKRQGKGVIINTASLAAYLPNHEPICYPVSKAALKMLTQATARELGGTGVRVVAVAPGWVRSVVKGGTVADPFSNPAVTELHIDNRVVEADEVAEVVYFLSTDAASGINGTVIKVDDGYTAFKVQSELG